MPGLPEELLAEEGIAEAFAAMQEAIADPEIRALIESRARSQQEEFSQSPR
jgi:hypothetical protein